MLLPSTFCILPQKSVVEHVILKVSSISTVGANGTHRHCRLSDANSLWMKAQKDPHLDHLAFYFCPPLTPPLERQNLVLNFFGTFKQLRYGKKNMLIYLYSIM